MHAGWLYANVYHTLAMRELITECNQNSFPICLYRHECGSGMLGKWPQWRLCSFMFCNTWIFFFEQTMVFNLELCTFPLMHPVDQDFWSNVFDGSKTKMIAVQKTNKQTATAPWWRELCKAFSRASSSSCPDIELHSSHEQRGRAVKQSWRSAPLWRMLLETTRASPIKWHESTKHLRETFCGDKFEVSLLRVKFV